MLITKPGQVGRKGSRDGCLSALGFMPSRTRSIDSALCLAVLVAVCLALPGMAQHPPRMEQSQTVSVPLLAPAQMSPPDAAFAESSKGAVSRSAQIYGYALGSSNSDWTYRQIACPFASKHLLLAYESAGPRGVASRFTAILRRGAEEEITAGRTGVEIIPVVHFGVVPFIPAYTNPHTFDLFNEVVPSAHPVPSSLSADDPLLWRSLCFTAMIGEPPNLVRTPSLDPATLRAPVPTVLFLENRAVRTQFSVRNSDATYQVWTLTFSSAGKLLAANKEEHTIDTTTPLFNAATTQAPNLETAPLGVNSSIAPTAPEASVLPARPMPVSPPPVGVTQPATASVAPTAAGAVRPGIAEAPPSSAVVSPAKSATMASRSQVAPASLPLPPRRVVTDLPVPPHRIIPDSAMSYPPQSPTPH